MFITNPASVLFLASAILGLFWWITNYERAKEFALQVLAIAVLLQLIWLAMRARDLLRKKMSG